MSINIAAKHIEMNDYLKSHIEDKIDHLESKYNVKMIADVHFDKSGNNIKAKIICNDMERRHKTIVGDAEDFDITTSFDNALEKLDHQLHKVYSKEKSHNYNKIS